MRLSVARQYLNFTGRLSRRRFNDGAILLILMLLCWLMLPSRAVAVAGVWPGLLALVALIALAVPRLHDIDRAAVWLLLLLVPVVGPLWLGWRLCTQRGMTDENRFGADPDAPSPDYLVVS